MTHHVSILIVKSNPGLPFSPEPAYELVFRDTSCLISDTSILIPDVHDIAHCALWMSAYEPSYDHFQIKGDLQQCYGSQCTIASTTTSSTSTTSTSTTSTSGDSVEETTTTAAASDSSESGANGTSDTTTTGAANSSSRLLMEVDEPYESDRILLGEDVGSSWNLRGTESAYRRQLQTANSSETTTVDPKAPVANTDYDLYRRTYMERTIFAEGYQSIAPWGGQFGHSGFTESALGKDWILVRWAADGSLFHAATDQLWGTDAYGDSCSDLSNSQTASVPSSYSVRFYDRIWFGYYMFARADGSEWVIVSKQNIDSIFPYPRGGTVAGTTYVKDVDGVSKTVANVTVDRSSLNSNSHTLIWEINTADGYPLVSANGSVGLHCPSSYLYAGNSLNAGTGAGSGCPTTHGGVGVFVQLATTTTTTTTTTATTTTTGRGKGDDSMSDVSVTLYAGDPPGSESLMEGPIGVMIGFSGLLFVGFFGYVIWAKYIYQEPVEPEEQEEVEVEVEEIAMFSGAAPAGSKMEKADVRHAQPKIDLEEHRHKEKPGDRQHARGKIDYYEKVLPKDFNVKDFFFNADAEARGMAEAMATPEDGKGKKKVNKQNMDAGIFS